MVLSQSSVGASASPHLLRFSLAEGTTAIPALDVLMRRLRRRGVRLTLHYSAGAWELRALPLRCVQLVACAACPVTDDVRLVSSASRALAVRYLSQQWGVPLEKVLVLASQDVEPDGDRAELLGGLVRSVLVGGAPPPSPRTASRPKTSDSFAMVSADDIAIAAAHVSRTIHLDSDRAELLERTVVAELLGRTEE